MTDRELEARRSAPGGLGKERPKRGNGFAKAALLAAGLALGGCTYNTYNNYNYSGADGGAAESGPATDGGSDGSCHLEQGPALSCGSTVSATLAVGGDVVSLGSVHVQLEGTEDHAGVPTAIIDILDDGCAVRSRNAIQEGGAREIALGDADSISVEVGSVSSDSVDVVLGRVCGDGGSGYCADSPVIAGWMNQGESLPFNGLQLQLDDIVVVPSTEPPGAALTLLDSMGMALDHYLLRPGESVTKEVGGNTYQFSVSQVIAGYTFGAKRAEAAVYSCPPSGDGG